MSKIGKALFLWLIIILVAMWFAGHFATKEKVEKLSYSSFKQAIKEDKIIECAVSEEAISGQYYNPSGKKVRFTTVLVADTHLIEELEAHQVNYKGELRKSWWSNLLLSFGPILLFLVFWIFLMRQMQGPGNKAMAFGRSRAKLQSQQKKVKTTFQDVAGVEEAKEELQEIIEFLKNPRRFQKLGGRIPKGVLLYGAPGTGKTLLAKAVAGEAKVSFFNCSGSDFVEMFVGVGASRVRDLFEKGRRSAPCLIFIDEIDAVGRQRFAGIGGGHDEREQTLNQLLAEMDGFDTKEGVVMIAATNRPDVLDAALLRPGRFDRQIFVNNPDIKGREQILKIHTRNLTLSSDVKLNILSQRTPGFVGSDLANIANEAALLAARRNKKEIGMEEFEEATDRVIAGPERRSRVINPQEKKIIACHESGHALIAKLLPLTDPVHKISVIPRGPSLGYTLQRPLEDKYIHTKEEILSKLAVLLGGRASEELIFNQLTTGAQDDLEKATESARQMVCEFGMSEKLGPLTFRKKPEKLFLGRDLVQEKIFSEKTSEEIDKEVTKIITSSYARAKKLLAENKSKLSQLAKKLMEKETLAGEEIDQLLKEEIPGEETESRKSNSHNS